MAERGKEWSRGESNPWPVGSKVRDRTKPAPKSVPLVGFEPTRSCEIVGFKDRCVYQFRHRGMFE